MADTTLRPRTVVEILDATFSLLRRDYAKYAAISAALSLPSAAANLWFTRAAAAVESGPSAGSLQSVGIMMSAAAVPILISLLWSPFIDGAIIHAASEAYHGRQVGVGESIRKIVSRFVPLVIATILRALILVAGVLMLVLPFFYFFFRYYCFSASVVLEGSSPVQSLRRSGLLTEGHVWKTFLVWFVMQIITFCIVGLWALTAIIWEHDLLRMITEQVLTVLIYPIVPVSIVVIFYDLRIRKEGYDLEVMSGEIGEANPQPAS